MPAPSGPTDATIDAALSWVEAREYQLSRTGEDWVAPNRAGNLRSTFDDGTLMRDTVDYELPLGPLGALVNALFVRRSVERIFDYRRKVLRSEFG